MGAIVYYSGENTTNFKNGHFYKKSDDADVEKECGMITLGGQQEGSTYYFDEEGNILTNIENPYGQAKADILGGEVDGWSYSVGKINNDSETDKIRVIGESLNGNWWYYPLILNTETNKIYSGSSSIGEATSYDNAYTAYTVKYIGKGIGWVDITVGGDIIKDVSELPTSSIKNIIYRLDNLLEYDIDYTETVSWAEADEYLQSFSDFLTENNIEHTTRYRGDTDNVPTAHITNPEIFLRTENLAIKDKPLERISFHSDTIMGNTLSVRTFDGITLTFKDKEIFTIYKGTNNTFYAGSEKNQTIERLANYEDVPDISKIPNTFTGTQEEWDALTENEKIEYDIANITDDNSGLEMPTEVYSTTETKTNKVWIDGKPIYRKVLTDLSITISNETWTNLCSATVFPNAQIITGGTLIDNGNRIINSNEMLFDNGYLRTEIMTGGSRTIKTVILEYTKTTD